ncbi:aminopeptidase N-like [Anopheles ziemanni]|uniref:aminopeptidase N-like n=1 Tax=Anopheles coustani TaxID=139045 RepID=UPI002658DEFC|nr:aminopeptidase N-like [Anopheles coustani]XP_058174968.1 aminopeptidase N-like [Anopheles ziemanni]
MRLILVVTVVAVLSGCAPASGTPNPWRRGWRRESEDFWQEQPPAESNAPGELRYRLPTYIVPYHYTVYLESEVHTGNRSYQGQVDIHLELQRQTGTIYVHKRDLRITYNALLIVNPNEDEVLEEEMRFAEDEEREFAIFSIRRALAPSRYILRIWFEGELRTDDDGFYLSSYLDTNGTRKYLAATQFQAISARAAFPCLDEPGLKATVSLQIKHHPSYQAVANMPINAIAGADDGYVVSVFETTPPLSIYLLAFMVSDFQYIEDLDARQRVYARPTSINETQYALETGVRLMATLDEYLGIPYSTYMPKVDQVGIPDFSAGAMENWGLCNYREELLLNEPGVTSYRSQTSITTVVAHEFAHQWFGNLVTNAWWSYLWLNEGFASLYEYMAAEMAYPQRGYRDLFNVQLVHRALNADSSETTRPMTFSRGATYSAIVSLFDNVAYAKGGSVLRMFRELVTDDVWRTALRGYLQANEFGAVTTDHFVAALEEATEDLDVLPDGVDMGEFVGSWVEQAGYPVLEVRRTYRGEMVVSQDRFYNNKIVNDDRSVWMIPYTILEESDSLSDPLEYNWLTVKAARVPTTAGDDEWILANVNQHGFYRVNYDTLNWYMLIEALIDDPTTIPLQNRAQLVDDSFYLARSNRLDVEITLELLTYLRHEREYPPWEAASRVFNYFNNRMRGHPDYVLYQLYVDTLIGDVFMTLDVATVDPDERLLHKYLRQTITSWACRMEIESCLTQTQEALQLEVTGEQTVHPDVASVVYCYGLRTGSDSTAAFQYLYDKLLRSANRGERQMLIDALGCALERDQLDALLLASIGGDLQVNFDEEERYDILLSVLVSREGVDALIDFLSENFEYVASILGRSTVYSLVQSIATRTNNEEEQRRLDALLQQLDAFLPESLVASVQQTVAYNLEWPSTREGVLVTYFLQRYRPIPI